MHIRMASRLASPRLGMAWRGVAWHGISLSPSLALPPHLQARARTRAPREDYTINRAFAVVLLAGYEGLAPQVDLAAAARAAKQDRVPRRGIARVDGPDSWGLSASALQRRCRGNKGRGSNNICIAFLPFPNRFLGRCSARSTFMLLGIDRVSSTLRVTRMFVEPTFTRTCRVHSEAKQPDQVKYCGTLSSYTHTHTHSQQLRISHQTPKTVRHTFQELKKLAELAPKKSSFGDQPAFGARVHGLGGGESRKRRGGG